MSVKCGNIKLMKSELIFKANEDNDVKYEELIKNIGYLE